MVAFGHTAVGALIGLYTYQHYGYSDPTQGLAITVAAGVVSHYIFDVFPHGHFFKEDEYQKKVGYAIVFDLALSILIYLATAYIFSQANLLFVLYILFGIAASQLPDVIDGLIFTKRLPKKGILKWEFDFHRITHWHGTKENTRMWSVWDAWQVLLFFFGLYLLLTSKI